MYVGESGASQKNCASFWFPSNQNWEGPIRFGTLPYTLFLHWIPAKTRKEDTSTNLLRMGKTLHQLAGGLFHFPRFQNDPSRYLARIVAGWLLMLDRTGAGTGDLSLPHIAKKDRKGLKFPFSFYKLKCTAMQHNHFLLKCTL